MTGEELRRRRTALGLSLRALASETGVLTHRTIWNAERGDSALNRASTRALETTLARLEGERP